MHSHVRRGWFSFSFESNPTWVRVSIFQRTSKSISETLVKLLLFPFAILFARKEGAFVRCQPTRSHLEEYRQSVFVSSLRLVLFPFPLLFLTLFHKTWKNFQGNFEGIIDFRGESTTFVLSLSLSRWERSQTWMSLLSSRKGVWQEGPSTKFSTEETCASR